MNFHDISWSLDWFEDLICEFWRGLREKCEALEGSHTNVFIRFKTTKSSRQVIDPIDQAQVAQVAQARVVAVPHEIFYPKHWKNIKTRWKKFELKQKFEN